MAKVGALEVAHKKWRHVEEEGEDGGDDDDDDEDEDDHDDDCEHSNLKWAK